MTESLERYRAARAFAEAIACAKRLLASDPWREDTVRSLLAVRYESGDTAGALAEYEQFAKRLRDELAIAPMPETIAVRQSILRNEAVPGSLDGPPRPAAADRDGQRADIDELERLSSNDPLARFDVLERRVLLARTLGESEEEGRRIAEMELVAESLGVDARAKAHLQRGTHAGLRSRPSEGLEPVRFALATYERLGDVRQQLECLYLLIDFTLNVGDVEASRGYLALMRDRAASLGDPVVEARALSVAANAALQLQEYRECFDLTTRALALHVATNDREGEAFSHLRLASNSAWLADFDTALREFDLSLETHEAIGHKRGIALTYTNRTMLLMRLGLFDEALVSIERSDALFETVHEQRTIDLTLAYVEAGRVRDGLATAEELGTIGATSLEGGFGRIISGGRWRTGSLRVETPLEPPPPRRAPAPKPGASQSTSGMLGFG